MITLRNRPTLRRLYDKVTEIEWTVSVYINKGKEKSRLGFLPDAVVVAGLSAGLIQSSFQPILITLLVRIALTPLFIFIGWFWKKSGAWDREADFVARLTPLFRRLDEHKIRRLDRRRNRNIDKSINKI